MLSAAVAVVLCIAVAWLWLALRASQRQERTLRLNFALDGAKSFRLRCVAFLRAAGWQVTESDAPIPGLFFLEKDRARLAACLALEWIQADFADIGAVRKQAQKGFTPVYITGGDPDAVRARLAAQGVDLRVVHYADLPLLHVLCLPDLIPPQPGPAYAAADGLL